MWLSFVTATRTSIWHSSARIVAEDGRLGLTEGRFGFSHAGVAGSSVLVEASEDGGRADWTPVSTHTLSPQVRAQFTEAAQADRPGRFYQMRVP